MAGQISYCPGCHAPVVIPTAKPTHRGTPTTNPGDPAAVYIPPKLSHRSFAARNAADSAPIGHTVSTEASTECVTSPAPSPANATSNGVLDVTPDEVFLVPRGRKAELTRSRRRPESRWSESLLYTVPTSLLFARLALGLAICSSVVALALPHRLHQPFDSTAPGMLPFLCAAMLPVLLGYACAFLNGVLALAIEGSPRVVFPPNVDSLFRPILKWTVCFAVGPAPLLGLAGMFWLHCGDPTLLDRLLLTELVVMACGAFPVWLLLANATGKGGIGCDPRSMLRLIRSLDRYFVAGSVLATAAIVGIGWLGTQALARLHASVFEGFAWLVLWWFCALFLAAFGVRRLGLWYYRGTQSVRKENRRHRSSQPPEAAVARTHLVDATHRREMTGPTHPATPQERTIAIAPHP